MGREGCCRNENAALSPAEAAAATKTSLALPQVAVTATKTSLSVCHPPLLTRKWRICPFNLVFTPGFRRCVLRTRLRCRGNGYNWVVSRAIGGSAQNIRRAAWMGGGIHGNLSQSKSIAHCAAAFILPPFRKTNILRPAAIGWVRKCCLLP